MYTGEHTITFGEKNSWDDWHLIPTSRPVFSPPQPNIRLLNIPGKSGSLDVTDAFGQVVYADRTGSFEFYVDHETKFKKGDKSKNGPRAWNSWMEAYQEITAYLHGKKLKATLSDDPDYYYEGRFSVNEWRSNPSYSTIVINYTVGPYKMMHFEYGCNWLWDEADLHDRTKILSSTIGILLDQYGNTGATVVVEGYGYRTIPTIECDQPGVVMYFDKVGPIELQEGANRPSVAVITEGRHVLRFVGEGSVSVHYRGGAL